MRSVLVISDQRESIDRTKQSLPDECSVFIANSEHEALELVRNISVDLVLMDAVVINDKVLETATKIKSDKPNCVVLCTLGVGSLDEDAPDLVSNKHQIFDFFIRKPIIPTEAAKIIQSAFEKQELLQELADLRHEAERVANNYAAPNVAAPALADVTSILTAMARILSTSFDLDRFMNLFLEIVADMLRLNRAALMIYDSASDEYRIKAHRGLLPQIASNTKLRETDVLPSWLISEGRLITKSEAETMRFSPTFRQLNAELGKLQAVVSIPLLARGNLVGILNIGPRVTGVPYTNPELETLFILASHVAVSIQDSRLYHQIQYQKRYIENILVHMSSGVITIDSDEKVVIYNRRAAEILKIPEAHVLNRDLRALPSPLGDILFETLRDGKSYQKVEIQLALRQIPLEVSSYQIEDGGKVVSGSVMVFEDLSQRKQLECERRRSIELDLFNRITAAMAHEIKNPLVSIHTFVELLPSQFDDPEFRDNFSATVQSDVKRLDEIVEKIVSFADPTPHNFELGDIEALLNDCIRLLKEEGVDQGVDISLTCESETPPIRYDRTRMTKAFLYLMLYLVRDVDLPTKVKIAINPLRSNEAEKQLEIEIRCDGKMAPSEPLTDLFGLLSESQATIVDLGLSVSQRIIADHRWHLAAKASADGKLIFLVQIGS